MLPSSYIAKSIHDCSLAMNLSSKCLAIEQILRDIVLSLTDTTANFSADFSSRIVCAISKHEGRMTLSAIVYGSFSSATRYAMRYDDNKAFSLTAVRRKQN